MTDSEDEEVTLIGIPDALSNEDEDDEHFSFVPNSLQMCFT